MTANTVEASPSQYCGSCGLISVGGDCPGCQCPSIVTADPQLLGDLLCAVVRAELPCRICGLQMPINHLPQRGQVRCLSCDRPQAADDSAFQELIEKAHGVVDLAGEDGPYERVGMQDAAAYESVSQGRATIGPGMPRCLLCRGALRLSLGGGRGVVTSVCTQCDDTATHQVELSQRWKGLVAAIAPEHRTDRPSAKKSFDGAVLALGCPKCGGPLDPNPQQPVVKCGYCETTCLIVEETWALLKGAPPKQAWYLLFQGTSKLRRDIDEERERRQRREEAERNKQRKSRARDQQRYVSPSPIKRESWYRRNRSLVAGFSTIVSGFACCGLVAGGLHLMGYEEESVPVGFGIYFLVVVIGIALQGKGKIANMTTATATRVFRASAICFLVSIGMFLVMLTLSGR